MRKILITGAGGFIGSHVAELCVQEGYHVKAFLRYNSRNQWGWLESSPFLKDMEIHTGDIRDYDSVHHAMEGVDAVFHLAALIGIPYSYVSPLAYLRTNVEGTYNILQAARNRGLGTIVITSTSETYGTAQYVPIDEKHPLVGQSPYSASKIAADQLAISYHRSFGLPVRLIRPFNTFGPRQSARAIIPTIISQLLGGARELHLGNLSPTRDLTFVKDTARAFLDISNSNVPFGEATNVGSGREIAIGDLAVLICRVMDVQCEILKDAERSRPQGSEVERLLCDATKMKSQTNWSPKYTLQDGILETISWLRDNLSLLKGNLYNV
ncbi:MAG: GDP-mannose 4,6-dehydratase [Desulforhabdus sp.]|jgi:dTDP-glucose 4,6-dehydratase|nr:GDP-mannose 4,6-dehydratase [Desulforhabdus sp.]